MWYKIKRVLVWQNNQEKQVYPASRLPSAYQEVEYIKRNWNNYIDTWWVPNQTVWFEVDMWYKITTSYARYACLSNFVTSQWNSRSISLEISDGNKARIYSNYDYGGNEFTSSNNINTSNFNDIKFIANGSSWSINLNWTVTNWTIRADTYYNYSAYLFIDRALRRSTFSSDCYISYCTIYNAWTLVRDFVPCYRKSDSVIWMYDLVNNQFYTNSWSWTFAKWPDVN